MPGPGAYQPSKMSDTRAASYSLGGKYKIGTQMIIGPDGNHEKVVAQNEFNVPGPGTYTANYKQQFRSLSSKFGTEQRQSMALKGSQN